METDRHDDTQEGQMLIPVTQEQRVSFACEEYKALRVEIESCQKEIRLLETLAMTSIGVIWSWLLIQSNDQPPPASKYQLALWIPCVIVILLFFKRMMVQAQMWNIGEYLKELEDIHYREIIPTRRKQLGWETSLRRGWNSGGVFTFFVVGFYWIVLAVATFTLPFAISSLLDQGKANPPQVIKANPPQAIKAGP